ncbi:MAG: aminomethyltransferase family protein [Gammaproteobacteria bacterium]|nr:aminomethyltransferase family protein [Gammaproteobacteria bacterium]
MPHPNSITHSNTTFVVKPIAADAGASEFRQSMAPHPLVHQELPHDPCFGVYNRRLRSLEYARVRADDLYWRLRRQVGLSHTGELATEIRGSDAEAMLNRVFTREVSRVRVGRCSYQIACLADGGMLMDGILLRLAPDRFWYAQGDGEFPVWLRAHAAGFDVEVLDTRVWISQVQGPRSMDVLAAAADDGMPERFGYFDLAHVRIGGQPVVISRTGYTSELGWEFYFGADADAEVIGERIMAAGEQYGIHTIPAAATNARRIEGGLLFSGTDFDDSVTPFAAGLGAMVDLEKPDFIGKASLARADKRCRTWGLQSEGGVPRHGDSLLRDGESAGRVLSSAWSPYLDRGVAIVRLKSSTHGPGSRLQVECMDGQTRDAQVCELPMYDRAREIPRGKREMIP